MPAYPHCTVTVVCENPIEKDGFTAPCGHWLVVTRGDELPYCHACRQPHRAWRLATQHELAHRDDAFLRAIERGGADGHLGATEQER